MVSAEIMAICATYDRLHGSSAPAPDLPGDAKSALLQCGPLLINHMTYISISRLVFTSKVNKQNLVTKTCFLPWLPHVNG